MTENAALGDHLPLWTALSYLADWFLNTVLQEAAPYNKISKCVQWNHDSGKPSIAITSPQLPRLFSYE